MHRREFLKLGGLFSSAFIILSNPVGKIVSLPLEVQAHGKVYRATNPGKIYISENAGKTWQLHTNFGSEYSILDLRANLWDQVHAQLGFSSHNFELKLAQNEQNWLTV
jgi:hypothetical protein